jgi:hypothetical protein
MLSRIVILVLCGLSCACTGSEPAGSAEVQPQAVPQSVSPPATPAVEKPIAADSLQIRFDALSAKDGLTLSITAIGDGDGETTFGNRSCCGIKNAQSFIHDVRVSGDAHPIPTTRGASGWTVRHQPRAKLTVTYRLRPSGATTIDSGPLDQVKPIVQDGLFHLIGDMALLLPAGRDQSDLVDLEVNADRVADDEHFVSSFGPGSRVRVVIPRSQIRRGLYLGGTISLLVKDTPAGKIGVAYSAMDPAIQAKDLFSDVLAIIKAEQEFFNDSQPWYLVSVHGGKRLDPSINIGGGSGLHNTFASYVWSGLDLANGDQHREQLRWLVAHEYFHQWDGLTLRVASRKGSSQDDTSIYWFTEGVTEFYTMRLLTRAGLQTPSLSLAILNDKLRRYAANSKRGLSANAAGELFWSNAEAADIPYLRGYLAASYADLAMMRASNGKRGLDDPILALVARARKEPDFRVDNSFLTAYLGESLPADVARSLRSFVIDGGESPLASNSFAPCLAGRQKLISGSSVLQFSFADVANDRCFRH